MSEPIVRVTLLDQALEGVTVSGVQLRRITLAPDVAGGPHHHNGPVFGTIESGSVVFQVDGGPETVLRAGDAFYEPSGVLIDRFDATAEGVTFVGCFLSGPGESPELTPGPPAAWLPGRRRPPPPRTRGGHRRWTCPRAASATHAAR